LGPSAVHVTLYFGSLLNNKTNFHSHDLLWFGNARRSPHGCRQDHISSFAYDARIGDHFASTSLTISTPDTQFMLANNWTQERDKLTMTFERI